MSYRKHLDRINKTIDEGGSLSHHFDELRKSIVPWRESLRVILIYIIIGAAWILFSDRLLSILFADPQTYQSMQTIKGWVYVLLSGSVFYFMIRNRLQLFKAATDRIYQGYLELDESHDQLSKAETELRERIEQLEYYQKALKDSQLQYDLSVAGANDGIWTWDLITGAYKTSTLMKPEFGYTELEQADTDTMEKWRTFVHPEDLFYGVKAIDNYLENGEGIYENIFRIRAKDGIYRWILSRGKAVRDEDGKTISFAGSHTDITHQLQLQENLKLEQGLVESISKEAPISIIVCDKNGLITKFNQYSESVFGHTQEELIGKNVFDLLGDDVQKRELVEILLALMKGEPLTNAELKVIAKDGSEKTLLFSNTYVWKDGYIESLVFIGVDITERKSMEEKLEVLAYKDRLTDLPNMAKFREELSDVLIRSDNSQIAIIYIDIDDFKLVNDTMGHHAGDLLIREFADDLLSFAKTEDRVYRFGGDEYVVVLRSFTNESEFRERLAKLMEVVRRPWIYNDHNFMISSSVGVAVYPDHGNSIEALMQNADTALSYAKTEGKSRYLIYNDYMKDKTWSFIQLTSDLRMALERNEFILVYQPQYNLIDETLVGFEALIRWIHPLKGMIYPMDFIPFAEATGLIDKIEDWVLETACRQSSKWESNGLGGLKISINISGNTLSKSSWVDKVGQKLGDYTDYGRVIFEITETAVIGDMEDSIKALETLHDMGIYIALDDFGTGYSSLTYLQKLPIDIIKLDKSFVWSIGIDDDKSFIVKTVIDLAHRLGIKVVAEGVETKEQLIFLKDSGCDLAQGYYFSKPLDASSVDALLKAGAKQ
jgi:diguanylate cyclase (GGDEF)-like protein/PAS domain S-box-containing protein